MAGLFPDPVAGSVVITDANNTPQSAVPQMGLFTTVGTSFTITGGLSYLQVPSVAGSCGGRVTPMQINFIESELIALCQKIAPNFTWNPNSGINLATAFAMFIAAFSQGGLTLAGLDALIPQLPTTLPAQSGIFWNDGGVMAIS